MKRKEKSVRLDLPQTLSYSFIFSVGNEGRGQKLGSHLEREREREKKESILLCHQVVCVAC